jgi:hypothetical protein
VLPDAKGEPFPRDFIEQLGMEPGPALAVAPRPPDRKGQPTEPLTLHLLMPRGSGAASAPTTTAATAGERPPT